MGETIPWVQKYVSEKTLRGEEVHYLQEKPQAVVEKKYDHLAALNTEQVEKMKLNKSYNSHLP